MPPVLGLPPAIQIDVAEARQRARGAVGVGGLRIVDEQHASLAADRLHAVGEAGKRGKALLDGAEIEAEREAGGDGAGRVLRIVRAAQRADAGEIGDRRGLAVLRVHDP